MSRDKKMQIEMMFEFKDFYNSLTETQQKYIFDNDMLNDELVSEFKDIWIDESHIVRFTSIVIKNCPKCNSEFLLTGRAPFTASWCGDCGFVLYNHGSITLNEYDEEYDG